LRVCGYHSTVKTKPVSLLTKHALAGALAGALALGLPSALAQGKIEAPLPTLGDTSRVDLSPIMERKVGEEVMNDIRRNRDYLDDDILLAYLNDFGNALLAVRPDARGDANYDYFFFAVRDPMLNAFALPGGFIAVHSALLLAAQTESELASVLGHEIGHVAQRHIARMLGQQKQDALIPLAAMVLAILAARASPDVSMAVMQGGQGLAISRQLSFGRDAEREADRLGFQIMSTAGFDTSGMVAFFGRMQTASRNYSDLTPSYLRSHPLTGERIADIQARIRETPYRQRADSIDFHLVRARTRVLQDESAEGRAESKLTLETQLKQQNRQQQVAAQYGLSYLALRQGDLAGAQRWLDMARATVTKKEEATFSVVRPNDSTGAAIFASLSLEIKLANGQPAAVKAAAVKEAQQAHLQFPLSRGIARQVAEALAANGQLDEAVRFLRDQVQLYRSEHKLYDLLAKTYAEQGKMALQHMALAESYALTGSVLGALDQLVIARKASDASFYDMAVIDARERELQTRHRDDTKEKKEQKF
jgi:predicted Zn-dependent protease